VVDVVRVPREERFHVGRDARHQRCDDRVRLQVALVEIVVDRTRLMMVEWTVTVPHRKLIAHPRIVAASRSADASRTV
jgi:hypothetical protein